MHSSKITLTALGLTIAQFVQQTSCIPAQLFSNPSVSISEAPSAHQLSLSRHPSRNIFSSPARQRHRAITTGKGSEIVNTIFSGVYPVLNLTWLGSKPQDFIAFIDTGSADTWVVSKDFQCLDVETGKPRPQQACQFGNLYDPALGSFQNIPSLEFSIHYFPENVSLDGSMGYAPLKLGGLTVPKQEVALVTKSAWAGDGVSSALVGFAYPAVTSASYRSNGSQAIYDPVFTTMAKQKIVDDAVFTIALDRVPPNTSPSTPAGLMAFGGLVPSSYYVAPFTTVPIEETDGISGLSFYTISHQLTYNRKDGTTYTSGTYQSIVDSGTAPNFVPSAQAADINNQFTPSAVYNETLGYWTVDCNAKAPYVAYKIGGKVMPMNPKDMIVRDLVGLEGYENVCFSAFADGGAPGNGNVYIIGEVWQLNYVVSYDQKSTQMHFATRAA